MKKILIDENKQKAEQHIQSEVAKAKRMTAIIEVYNKQEALTPLDKSSALEFLSNPKEFLDNAIIQDSGLTLKNVQASKLADLVGIQYSKITSLIGVWDIENFILNDGLSLTLSNEAREQIYEQHKFYLTKDEDIKLYRELQGHIKNLNELFQKLKVDNFDVNAVGRIAGLETSRNEDDRYQFVADVKTLKKMLSD